MTRTSKFHLEASRAVRPALIALAVAAGALSRSGAATPPPEGIEAGPWVFAPSFVAGIARDTNPFYRREGDTPGPETEWISRVNPVVRGILPFRASRFELSLDGSRTVYSQTQTDQKWALTGGGKVDLRLSSGDEIGFSVQSVAGIADVLRFDPGGEVVYQGESYAYATYGFTANRIRGGHRGWSVEVVREDLDFDEDVTASFFEFRGWRWGLTYREPVTPALWGTATWRARRFDDFRASVPAELGIPFRTEDSNDYMIGLEGMLAGRHMWRLRWGRADYEFSGEQYSAIRTWVVDGEADIAITEASHLVVVATRRPYPSFFFDNDYYVSGSLFATLTWTAPTGTSVGTSVLIGRNEYDQPVPLPDDPNVEVYRSDRLARVELYAKVQLGQRVGLVISASHERRNSTYPADYDKAAIFGGMSFGWF